MIACLSEGETEPDCKLRLTILVITGKRTGVHAFISTEGSGSKLHVDDEVDLIRDKDLIFREDVKLIHLLLPVEYVPQNEHCRTWVQERCDYGNTKQ